jgi:uncharacterized SAM-dependent methyltransferase
MTSREPILANLSFHDYQPPDADIAREVLTGLRQEQPGLHPKFLYDARGSRLFEGITRQPEYYPTATEKALLTAKAPELAGRVHPDTLIAEPGAGNGEKARLLLDHWQPRGYMPIEISRDELLRASRDLGPRFPGTGHPCDLRGLHAPHRLARRNPAAPDGVLSRFHPGQFRTP